ncbi:engulfment and cell motility protein 1-like isoform X3 [Oncorhynchus clarkii lewisi]|uniref:engulfment and cell motility protein 1-like isoform X3 n=1 Tax=Oncorhynchus clarkii lewisi TaxID=490388 RepID=UPI0039B87DE4
MPPPSDIVKVAIEWPGAFPKLMEIDQKKPLSAIIKEVCEGWSLGNHENFALQNADSTNFYITEKNRSDIKNGSILRLTTSPSQTAAQLHERIQSSSMDAKLEALKDLANSSRDVTFAQEFINLDGISLLTQMVESGTETDQDIQTYTIAVINALFLKAPEDKRQEMAHILAQKQLRSIILSNVIRSPKPINDEMAHQLYVLQVLTFNLLEDRMMTKMDPQDQAQRDIIFELRRIAFDVECEPNNSGSIEKRKSMYTRDYKKLGFINHVNPAMDFTQIPPGMLALDNMLYFARHHQDAYIRIVLENSSREDKHECPFGRSSIELTKMLCETLKVGELPSENCHDFHPMFFTHDRSFEEFFCICIQLLNKTWKEMRATSEDFNKVMQVVRDQIMRALTQKPNSLDQLKSRLQNLSYTEILKIRQSERMNQEDFQSRPILELREKIQPEIMELIKQQRLNRLCDGTCFRKISSRRRQDKFWYCRLSPNHKVLHYGDLEESPQGEVSHDLLQEKLPVADIKAVVTGKDCPHMKEKGALKQNKEVLELAFSVLYESDEYLNFIAPDKHEYCVWTDGLNALLGKEMTSDFTKSDMDTLLSMEMKLRLLDLENIQIPEAPPPIPKEPSNYDFVYDCN